MSNDRDCSKVALPKKKKALRPDEAGHESLTGNPVQGDSHKT